MRNEYPSGFGVAARWVPRCGHGLRREQRARGFVTAVTFDLVFIGGGFRTTTFIASAPDLLKYRIAVLERGPVIGSGKFRTYAIITASIGSRFLKEVQFSGPFERLSGNEAVARVAKAGEPIQMRELANALDELGNALRNALGPSRLHLDTHVVAVDVHSSGPGVVAQVAGGPRISAHFAVLATGRRERPHSMLAPWRSKVVYSSEIISFRTRRTIKQRLVALGRGSIVIAGCSHSAMSALTVLMDLFAELHQEDSAYRRPSITVLRRSRTRLMYDDVEHARACQIPERELIFDALHDVCPVTGIVFRDSGLRHESRALFCELWAGNVDGARLLDVESIGDVSETLDAASLVVQALGYHGDAPDIRVDGALARPSQSSDRLLADKHGAAILHDRPHGALSVLRVEPTPAEMRDNVAYGSGLYPRLATRLMRQLDSVGQKENAR
jgi:hypothetical protein